MRIVEACETFIQHCGSVRKLSEHTTRAYRLDLNRFIGFAGEGAEIESCERATLQQYIEHLFTQHHLKETSALDRAGVPVLIRTVIKPPTPWRG